MTTPTVAPIKGHTTSEYLTLPSGPSAWLLKPVIPLGGSAMLMGPAKAGKSCAALQLTTSLAAGKPFLGFEPAKAARILYAQIDTPRSLWRERIENLTANGIPLPEEGIVWIDKEDVPFPFNILDPGHHAAFTALVARSTPDLVIIDTLRESYRGDENDSDRLQQVLSSFTLACRPAAILYVHHAKKAPSGKHADQEVSLMDQGRGSSFIPGAVDCILGLKAFKPSVNKSTGEMQRKGLLTLQGRALDHTEIKLEQDQVTYLWQLQAAAVRDVFKEAVDEIIHDLSFSSDTARAEALASQFPKNLNACKVALSRARASLDE